MSTRRFVIVSAAVAWLVSATLTLATYRAGRLLTFDAYFYCELAKQFAETWPDRFGNHWPFGYPLAGALLVRAGLPAFESLALISSFALFALAGLGSFLFRERPLRFLVPAALAAAPIMSVQHLGVLTELPFATCLLGLVVSLAHWPHRGALWASGAFAVGALATRYAGVIAFCALGCWLAWSWRQLRDVRRLRVAIAAVVTATALGAGLLLTNLLQSGHISGASRAGAPGLPALPRELVDFGWSIPSAIFSGGIRDRIGMNTTLGTFLGAAFFTGVVALCAASWFRPRSTYSRPLALVVFGYSAGMAVLHCVGSFDALYNARTFLPALFPCGLLAADLFLHRRWLVIAFCLLLLAAGAAAGVRGISREIGGDVRAAAGPIRARLQPGDTVAINDDAFTLSAYLPLRTTRIWADSWREDHPARFVVIAAKPADRSGAGVVSPEWRDRFTRALARGTHRSLVDRPGLLVLEKTPGR